MSMRSSSSLICCGARRVEHEELRIPGERSERVGENVGRKRAAAHAADDGGVEVLLRFAGERLEARDRLEHVLLDVEPAQRLLDDGGRVGIVRPERGIVRPEPLEEIGLTRACRAPRRNAGCDLPSARSHALARRPTRAAFVCRRSRRAARRTNREKSVTPSTCSCSVTSKSEIFASCSPRMTSSAPRRSVSTVSATIVAVIEQRVERLRRHRVDRIGADDGLDVHQIGIVRILRRRRGPQRPLHGAALRL